MLIQRKPCDQGVSVFELLKTYTGPNRIDQVMWDLVNRLTELCPIQWCCDQCRFRLHCGVGPGGQSFFRIPFVWNTSRTGRAHLQEANHPLMVPRNLYRWSEIGGLQENGNHTDYRVLNNLDKISPTMQVGGPCGMIEAIANTLSHVATYYASRHDSIELNGLKLLASSREGLATTKTEPPTTGMYWTLKYRLSRYVTTAALQA